MLRCILCHFSRSILLCCSHCVMKLNRTEDELLTHHVVSRKQLLQELSLFVQDGLQDEFIVSSDVEDGAAGTGVRELDQGLITERILQQTETLHLFWLMTIHWYDAALDSVRPLCFLERLLTWIIIVHFYCMDITQCLVFHRKKKVKNLV